MMRNLKQNVKAGFSLIEVMVATVILLIIVLMIGSVFRQGTSTWDSGYARAEGGMIVRAVIGSIQRELSTAIDGRLFRDVWTADDPVEVSQSKVKFICMKESDKGGTDLVREPMLVEYVWAGKEMRRTAHVLKYDDQNGTWRPDPDPDSTVESIVYSEDFQDDKKAIYSANFTFEAVSNSDGVRPQESQEFEENYFWNIPYVSIKVELTRTSNFSGLEIRSWGPDGKEGTSDDILVK